MEFESWTTWSREHHQIKYLTTLLAQVGGGIQLQQQKCSQGFFAHMQVASQG